MEMKQEKKRERDVYNFPLSCVTRAYAHTREEEERNIDIDYISTVYCSSRSPCIYKIYDDIYQ
jgi:hypothetical protein